MDAVLINDLQKRQNFQRAQVEEHAPGLAEEEPPHIIVDAEPGLVEQVQNVGVQYSFAALR